MDEAQFYMQDPKMVSVNKGVKGQHLMKTLILFSIKHYFDWFSIPSNINAISSLYTAITISPSFSLFLSPCSFFLQLTLLSSIFPLSLFI